MKNTCLTACAKAIAVAQAERLIYSNQVVYMYYTTDVEKAERHLKLAIHFDSTFAAPYLHLGTLYIRMGRYADALTILKSGLTKQNANRVAFLEGIARAHELKRDYAEAIKSYKEALASSVGFETANFTEGIKRYRKKRWTLMFG